MDPERWQQIDQLLQSSLERAPGQRAAFLAQACSGDESLRREVESLIASHEQEGNFLETPLSQIAADWLVKNEAQSAEGRTIGPYKVLAALGAGGMGEVYLAQDTRLDRKVALKLLPAYFTKDIGRLSRFEQEARSASSLNHPNILTIYEIGQEDGLHFIATEFIDGVTLRQRLTVYPSPATRDGSTARTTRMKLGEVLDIAGQVASALAAAHGAGIVHRDVKPENIMVRSDGYVKVLDFGLAKLTERQGTTTNAEAPTKLLVHTDPGLVMGTVTYMSPEQAAGIAVDERTDIWSLGVVLYEMVAGRAPFDGKTPSHVIVSLLEKEPAPLGRYAEVPTELERIINKSLRKNREERYQTVKDLGLDLKSLKQELEVEARLERSIQSAASGREAATKSNGQAVVETNYASAARPVDVGTSHPTSSAEYLVSEIKRHKGSAILAAAAMGIAVAVMAYFFYFPKGGEAIDSVAVLPFVNVSADPNAEYLSDGISDSIITSLSQLPNLRVMSLSSVLRYKQKGIDPQIVGRELNVRAVLMGRLIQHGDDFSISTELVDVRDKRRLWGQQYNLKLADLLTIQEKISLEVSENLRLRLSGEERKQLAKSYTENTEAYLLYQQGRYYFYTLTREGLNKSIEYFEQAINKDPAYAPAYVGLAEVYNYNKFFGGGVLPPKEARQKGESAVLKALALDPRLAEAHALLGTIRQDDDDWSAAEKEFKLAIELNPNSVDAHVYYGRYLEDIGQHDQAMTEATRALALDPLLPNLTGNVAYHFLLAGHYDQAIIQFQKALRMNPNMASARTNLGKAYLLKGMYAEAIAELEKARALDDSPESPGRFAALAYAYAVSGKRDKAEKMLGELQELTKQRYIGPYSFAIIYAGLGEKDQAFAWLEKAYKDRSGPPYLKLSPLFDSLRSDPRFANFAQRKGLAL